MLNYDKSNMQTNMIFLRLDFLAEMSDSVSLLVQKLMLTICTAHSLKRRSGGEFHPFKPVSGQLLFDADTDRRVQFCEVVRDLLNHDPAFMRKLKFSEECVFAL